MCVHYFHMITVCVCLLVCVHIWSSARHLTSSCRFITEKSFCPQRGFCDFLLNFWLLQRDKNKWNLFCCLLIIKVKYTFLHILVHMMCCKGTSQLANFQVQATKTGPQSSKPKMQSCSNPCCCCDLGGEGGDKSNKCL